jgi:nicotinamide-nucleotide adenylyltransferase
VVKSPKFSKKEEYNGTEIRNLMASGRKWKHLVPPAVAKVVEDVGGLERMRALARSDTRPQEW